jgi:hypothetical protein
MYKMIDGNFLYSGGEESVLVQWSLVHNNRKTFLPRLGAPITASCCSMNDTCILVTTSDNCVRVIDTARYAYIKVV